MTKSSYHRNRKIQRALLNIRLKCKGKPPLKDIEIPNAPRLITDGTIPLDKPQIDQPSWLSADRAIDWKPDGYIREKCWIDYLGNGYIYWGFITGIVTLGILIVYLTNPT